MAYSCRLQGAGPIFMLGVEPGRFARLGSDKKDAFAKNLVDRHGGATLSNVTVEASDVPRAGESVRFSYDMKSADGFAHVFGYATNVPDRAFTLMCIATDPNEPLQFSAFARSFRLLAPPPLWPHEKVSEGAKKVGAGLGLLLVLWWFSKKTRSKGTP